MCCRDSHRRAKARKRRMRMQKLVEAVQAVVLSRMRFRYQLATMANIRVQKLTCIFVFIFSHPAFVLLLAFLSSHSFLYLPCVFPLPRLLLLRSLSPRFDAARFRRIARARLHGADQQVVARDHSGARMGARRPVV